MLGSDHADVAVTLVELGRIYQDRGENDRAEPLLREALAIRERVLGREHGETANSLSGVASVLRLKGDLDGAQVLLDQVLALNTRSRGATHPNTGVTLHDLALLAIQKHDYPRAVAYLDRALDIHRKALGETHPNVAMDLNARAHVHAAADHLDEAAAAREQALAIVRATFGDDHQLVAIYSANLASVALARSDAVHAEPLLREALRIRALAPDVVPSRRRTLPEEAWTVGALGTTLGTTLTRLRRYDEAEAALLDARGRLEAESVQPTADLRDNAARLVDLYTAWGRPERAAAFRPVRRPRPPGSRERCGKHSVRPGRRWRR